MAAARAKGSDSLVDNGQDSQNSQNRLGIPFRAEEQNGMGLDGGASQAV